MKPYLIIKDVRIGKNMSQNSLAKTVGISQGYLSSLENNKKSPTLRMLCILAEALQVHPMELVIFL